MNLGKRVEFPTVPQPPGPDATTAAAGAAGGAFDAAAAMRNIDQNGDKDKYETLREEGAMEHKDAEPTQDVEDKAAPAPAPASKSFFAGKFFQTRDPFV